MMTRNELEEMLPDFAFGRLTPEQAEKFQKNVSEHPDLLKEIEDVKKIFSRVDKMDFDSILDQRTRNLSVRVNNRLKNQPRYSGFGYLLRFGVPAALVMVIMITLIKPNFEKDTKLKVNPNSFSSKLQKSMDFSEVDESSFSDYDYIENILPNENETAKEMFSVTELVDLKNIKKSEKNELFKEVSSNLSGADILILDDFNDMTEEEFQILLEDVKNVKI